jgi:hypothetical protein
MNKSLSKEEVKLLEEIESSKGVLRIFMSTEEIKICNKLVKMGLLTKGKNDAKNGTVIYNVAKPGANYNN